jgi:hypothetical protein
MSKAKGKRLRRAQQKRRQALKRRRPEDVVGERIGGCGAAAGRGSGESGEVGVRRVAEARAERGPAEEHEREVRVRLVGDGRGQVGRGEARAKVRDPCCELLTAVVIPSHEPNVTFLFTFIH